MRQLRQDCGGLLFLAIGDEVGACFGLPFLQDLHTTEDAVQRNPVLSHLITNDLRYDARSAFTLSLNHRDTYTGITDHDRALTTRRFAELATACMAAGESGEAAMKRLGEEFRTPGTSRFAEKRRGSQRPSRSHRTRCWPCSPCRYGPGGHRSRDASTGWRPCTSRGRCTPLGRRQRHSFPRRSGRGGRLGSLSTTVILMKHQPNPHLVVV